MSPPPPTTTIITENNNKRKRGDESDDEDEQPINNSTKSKKLSPVSSSSSSVQGTILLEENNVSMSDTVTTTNQLLVNNSVSSSSSSVQQTSTIVLTDKKEQFTTKLDPTQYNTWTKDEVYSLLCTPEVKGGAGLSSEDVKPLYDAGFKGTSLANIVKQLQSKDIDYAYQKISSNRDYQHISQTTLENVVNWVDNLLKTRLYHLWLKDHAKQQLVDSHLTTEQFDTLKIHKYGGIDTSDEDCKKIISNWLENNLIECIIRKPVIEVPTVLSPSFRNSRPQFSNLEEIAKIHGVNFKVGERYTDTQVVPFENREAFKMKAVDFIKTNVNTFQKNKECEVIQQFFLFGNLFNGSGSGKTRALKEFKNILLDIYPNATSSYMSFDNGTVLTLEEKHLLRTNNASKVLGWRIFCSFSNNLKVNNYDIFYSSMELFTFNNVMEWISKQLECTNDKPLYLILAIDEYQTIFQDSDIRTILLHVIGAACCCTEYPNEFLKKTNICVLPVIAGTIVQSETKEFVVSSYGKLSFYLSPLQSNHCKEIFLDLCSNHKRGQLKTSDGKIINVNDLWEKNDFSILYSQIAMIPKHALFIQDMIVEYCLTTASSGWERDTIHDRIIGIKEKIQSQAHIFFEELDGHDRLLFDLIISATSRTVMQTGSDLLNRVNGYISRGLLYLSTTKSVYCNWYQFSGLLKYSPILNQTLSNFSYEKISGDDFEIIGISTLVSRMNYLVASKLEYVSLSTLFPELNRDLLGIAVKLPPHANQYAEELDYFLPKKNKKEAHNKKSKKSEKNRIENYQEYKGSPIEKFNQSQCPTFIYKSKTNQKLVDARWFTVDNSSKKVMILMQWKLRKTGTLNIIDVLSFKEYENLKSIYSSFTVFFILITTAKVNPLIELSCREGQHDDYKNHVLYVDREHLMNNFSPNIMPYLRYNVDVHGEVLANESQTFYSQEDED